MQCFGSVLQSKVPPFLARVVVVTTRSIPRYTEVLTCSVWCLFCLASAVAITLQGGVLPYRLIQCTFNLTALPCLSKLTSQPKKCLCVAVVWSGFLWKESYVVIL